MLDHGVNAAPPGLGAEEVMIHNGPDLGHSSGDLIGDATVASSQRGSRFPIQHHGAQNSHPWCRLRGAANESS